MHMLEDGYSINYVHTNYGINEAQLSKLWFLYQKKEQRPFIGKNTLAVMQLLDTKLYWILKTMAYLWCKPQ